MCPINQVHYFYQGDQLYLELGAEQSRSLLRTVHGPLAQVQQLNGQASVGLLATDRQGSVLSLQNGLQASAFAYSVFGSAPRGHEALSLLGFNQQRRDPQTGCYLLGNGYRAYNPILMRFHSPDSLSPFGKGGINGYAYCGGDPVNWEDSSGHVSTHLAKSDLPTQTKLTHKNGTRVTSATTGGILKTNSQYSKPVQQDENNNLTRTKKVTWDNTKTVFHYSRRESLEIFVSRKWKEYTFKYNKNPTITNDIKATLYDMANMAGPDSHIVQAIFDRPSKLEPPSIETIDIRETYGQDV
ncbi:RHS repeat-associated core domain-containing protein [Pseudomonas sp. xss_2]|uniref:RHS repeat-associated core domain-containing protein n=1 Tax=Pseudomonas sp. xss_2 TaxID=3367215 RepID=UPI00370AA79F